MNRSPNNLIAKGNKVISAISYGYGTFIPEIAKKHPEVGFVVQMSDPKGPKTVASYYGKLEEVRYLDGVLAGKMSKTNIVGFSGAFPYAAVVSGVNAFALGVKSVSPSAKVVTNWVNSCTTLRRRRNPLMPCSAPGQTSSSITSTRQPRCRRPRRVKDDDSPRPLHAMHAFDLTATKGNDDAEA